MPVNEMTSNIFSFVKRSSSSSSKAHVIDAKRPPAHEGIKPEARLVERVASGDQEAFNELYRMFAPMVHGIILARVPRDEVDDIAQEVFLSAYKNLHTLRDKNSVGAWLAMIARNNSTE